MWFQCFIGKKSLLSGFFLLLSLFFYSISLYGNKLRTLYTPFPIVCMCECVFCRYSFCCSNCIRFFSFPSFSHDFCINHRNIAIYLDVVLALLFAHRFIFLFGSPLSLSLPPLGFILRLSPKQTRLFYLSWIVVDLTQMV